ncbi:MULTISPECIES: hypothetical protein [Halomicrobium]|nr:MULTISPECIES: hypothetical protein [Halomicrobium]QCD65387.1 hypothetical protein E5139_06955 [Halomicrobium mukohataei]QFR20193.1 hypothetical protein GBQ70_06950 [Halomicrobium sp. ZPS1]
MRTELFALAMAVTLVGAAVGPGVVAADDEAGNAALSVSVAQDEDVTISVTANDSAVENATVDVGGEEGSSYEGIGSYTTDDDGEVELDSPEANVTISVTATADNRTATTTADLLGEEYLVENQTSAFGQQVSAYVQSLLDGDRRHIGPQVAAFVQANNPGNAPAHAGPPEHAGPDHENETGDDNETAFENETDEDERGPPEHAGPDRENETDEDERGPPEHAGPDAEEDATDDEASETDDEAETEESEDEEDGAESDDDGGPPDHANAGGN